MPEQVPFSSVPFDLVRTPKAPSSANEDSSRLKEVCSELESLFIYYLMKEMRATVPKSGLIGGGKAEEMYTSLLDSHLAKEISTKGGIGLSSVLFDRLSAGTPSSEPKTSRKSD